MLNITRFLTKLNTSKEVNSEKKFIRDENIIEIMLNCPQLESLNRYGFLQF